MKLKKFIAILLLCSLSVSLPLKAMDLARVETRADLAVSTFGVSGQGVIVALLDRGIDWKNNDFRKADGTTRIKFIFDLTDNTGASDPGNPYGRGTIYTEAQINAALAGGPQLATRDAVGHGTTTAGIAAGNGRNSVNNKYRGIAPNASIIVVKVVTEGAPAHDGQPAEASFNDATAYPVAIDFVRDKAAALGMPAVMLLNLGSIFGPTDGTSSLARKIDATVGPGKPGLVFVTGAGDDGGMPNHAGGVVTQSGTAAIQIQKGSTGTLSFDLWYGGNDRFDVSLQTPSGNFGPYTSPATNNDESFVQNSTFTYYHKGASRVFFGATNGKREIFISLTGPVGTYTVQLQGQSVSQGRFDATINPSNIGQPTAQSNRFLNFVVPGSIWDGATAFNNICPNSYVIRNNWTDVDGVPRSIAGQGNPGELWLGSSVGPTFDNRLGLDVSAPGNSVFTTYNPTSYFATFRFNLIQDGGGLYGRADSVSAAAPQVTGIIALMLEKNPRLDAAQIKRMLQASARHDSFTGQTPNPMWGYGKVDALNAVALAAQASKSAYDFDGDGRADVAAWNPTSHNWRIRQSMTNTLRTQLDWGNGSLGDIAVPRDYDGDGKTDIAVYRPSESNWYIIQSSTNSIRLVNWGASSDKPVPADYDGDGKTDIAVFRPSEGNWYILNSATNTVTVRGWGASSDTPVPGFYDADAKADIAVYRPSEGNWYIIQSNTNTVRLVNWGTTGDRPVLADFDGDARTDIAVFRPVEGNWYILPSGGGVTVRGWGDAGDNLVPADYDGDGRADIAVFRPSEGNWYILQSTTNTARLENFAQGADDVPAPSTYIRL